MTVLGTDDEAERAHELAELGDAACRPGPLASLAEASTLTTLVELYAASLTDLGDRLARASADDPKLGYLRTLVVLTKKVELELRAHIEALARMNRELEEMHDLVHELFPGG
jgi:hypothetical protein